MSDLEARGKRVVIAHCDEYFLLAIHAVLTRRLGFVDVIETSTFDELLAKIGESEAERPVCLALFDLQMPGIDCAVSISAVRECFPGLKIAVVSSSKRRRDILDALESGAHGYLSRELSVNEFAKAIELILAGVIFVPPSLAVIPPAGPEMNQVAAPVVEEGASKVASLVVSQSAAATEALVGTLTRRQRDVLDLIVAGMANKEIARALSLSEGTVKVHVAALLRALRVNNRAGAAAFGARLIAKMPATASTTSLTEH